MKKIIYLLVFISLILVAKPHSGQLIVVSTNSYSSPKGTLAIYNYAKGEWRKKGKSINVFVGRNGLGWGIGLHNIPKQAKIRKREGDGKAPMGIFELKNAFGYFATKIAYPYKVYTKNNHCVDDIKSKYYNQIINSKKVKKSYNSFEYMRFKKNYYKYGIVVNHNPKNIPNKGSCIFIHIKDKPTAGCTAMNEPQMLSILKLLNKKVNPLLVQGTKEYIGDLIKSIRPIKW